MADGGRVNPDMALFTTSTSAILIIIIIIIIIIIVLQINSADYHVLINYRIMFSCVSFSWSWPLHVDNL